MESISGDRGRFEKISEIQERSLKILKVANNERIGSRLREVARDQMAKLPNVRHPVSSLSQIV